MKQFNCWDLSNCLTLRNWKAETSVINYQPTLRKNPERRFSVRCNFSEHIARTSISIVKPTRCTNVSNLFWNDTAHVSDGLSAHRQEFKTVHTVTGICHTDTAVCFPWSSISYPLEGRQQYLYDKCLLLCVQA